MSYAVTVGLHGVEGGVEYALLAERLGDGIELLDGAPERVEVDAARHGHHVRGGGSGLGRDRGVLLGLHHALEAVGEQHRLDAAIGPQGSALPT